MKACVLIANTDEALCRSLRHLLSRRSYHVESAHDGLECLTKLRQTKPDLCLLDLNLPWGGGDGVLECLREEAANQPLPITILCGLQTFDEIVDQLQPPVVRYMQKPVSLRAMFRALRAVCKPDRDLHGPNDTIAAIVHPLRANTCEQGENGAGCAAVEFGAMYSWGAMVTELGHGGIRINVCYPFRPGTYLAVELHTSHKSSNRILVRVVRSEAQQPDGTWALWCEFAKPVSQGEARLASPLTCSA